MADTVTICIPEGETLDGKDDPIVDNDLIWEWLDNQRNKSLSIRTVLALFVKEHGTADIRPRKSSRRRRSSESPVEEHPAHGATVAETVPRAPAPAREALSAGPSGQTLDATDINRLLDF